MSQASYKKKKKNWSENLPIVNESNNVALNDKWKECRLFVLQAIPDSIKQSMKEIKEVDRERVHSKLFFGNFLLYISWLLGMFANALVHSYYL